MPLDLYDELRRLAAALEEQKIEYAVVGALDFAASSRCRVRQSVGDLSRRADPDEDLGGAGSGHRRHPAAGGAGSVSRVDYSPAAVTARLREVRRLSDLTTENRLACKVDMSPAAVTHRLRVVSMLRRGCLALVRLGEANGLGEPPATAAR